MKTEIRDYPRQQPELVLPYQSQVMMAFAVLVPFAIAFGRWFILREIKRIQEHEESQLRRIEQLEAAVKADQDAMFQQARAVTESFADFRSRFVEIEKYNADQTFIRQALTSLEQRFCNLENRIQGIYDEIREISSMMRKKRW